MNRQCFIFTDTKWKCLKVLYWLVIHRKGSNFEQFATAISKTFRVFEIK